MKKYIIANWKSNKNPNEAKDWFSKIGLTWTQNLNDVYEIIVCVPFIDIEAAFQSAKSLNIKIGSQDISSFPEGPYTGEISARLLEGMVSYTMLGHSERREKLKENDEIISNKSFQAIEHNIIPIICFSNETEINNWGNYSMGKVSPSAIEKIIFAYEPLNAISTGDIGKPEDPQIVNELINKTKLKYTMKTCIYGGSVNENNINSFLTQPSVDGILVGAASLSPQQFVRIIQNATNQ